MLFGSGLPRRFRMPQASEEIGPSCSFPSVSSTKSLTTNSEKRCQSLPDGPVVQLSPELWKKPQPGSFPN